MVDGGGTVIQVILERSTGTAEAFDGYDPLSKSPVDPFESAFYKRRYYAVPIVLDDTTNWENSGEEQVFDLLDLTGKLPLATQILHHVRGGSRGHIEHASKLQQNLMAWCQYRGHLATQFAGLIIEQH